MIDERLKKYEPFFGKWHISDELGEGAFGKVYEIFWDDGLGSRSKSALKFMHIPSEAALKNQIETQPNMDAVRNFFAGQVERVKDEIRILQRCKGHSNIVSYEDHLIVEQPGREGIGWDILIRMELLYPISQYFARPDASQFDVVRMWLNITNALIYCEQQDIIHRDIKPTNILVSDTGMFKLSDFGAARRNLQGGDASTRIGTEQYMAPEVYKGLKYDRRADYYSLGCVIYFYLNYRRRPFMPPYPKELEQKEVDLADDRRMAGKEKIPRIPNVSRQVNDILLKSLAYRAQDRYRSASELYRVLQELMAEQSRELQGRWLDPSRQPVSLHGGIGEETGRLPVAWIALAAILMAGGAAGLFIGMSMRGKGKTARVLSLTVNEQRNEDGSVSRPIADVVSDLVISGQAAEDSRLILEINGETEYIDADGDWEYVVAGSPLEGAFREEGENLIQISYEDGKGEPEELVLIAQEEPAEQDTVQTEETDKPDEPDVPVFQGFDAVETDNPETVPDENALQQAASQSERESNEASEQASLEASEKASQEEALRISEEESQNASEQARQESEKASEEESQRASEKERKESEEASEEESQKASERQAAWDAIKTAEEARRQSEKESQEDSEKASEEESQKQSEEESQEASEEASERASEEARLESERVQIESEKARIESEKAFEEESQKQSEEARLESERLQIESEKARIESEKASEEESQQQSEEESQKASEEASEQARAESEKASEEASEQARAESEKASEEASEQKRAESEKASEEASEKARAESEKASEEASEQARAESEKASEEASEQARIAMEEEAKINAAAAAIKALPSPDTITESAEDGALVEAAEKALSDLDGDKDLLGRLNEALGGADAAGLVSGARASFDAAVARRAEEDALIAAAKAAIEALPETITAEDEEKVIAAETAYAQIADKAELTRRLSQELGGADPAGITAQARAAYVDAITPKARYYAALERPRNGDEVDDKIGLIGRVLSSAEVDSFELFADILLDGQLVQSHQIAGISPLREDTLAADAAKYASEIVAAADYDVLDQWPVEDLPDGTYVMNLRAVDGSGTEDVVTSVGFSINTGRAMSAEQLQALNDEIAPQSQTAAGYAYTSGEGGYTIAMDTDGEETIDASASQIILTGWLNAPAGTSAKPIVIVDGEESDPYTFDRITEEGGSAEFRQVPRYLEGMNAEELRGKEIYNEEMAGWILDLNLPFLEEGTHEIKLEFNMGPPDKPPEYANLAPVKVNIEAGTGISEGRVQAIADAWEREFPKPVEPVSEKETESTPGPVFEGIGNPEDSGGA